MLNSDALSFKNSRHLENDRSPFKSDLLGTYKDSENAEHGKSFAQGRM